MADGLRTEKVPVRHGHVCVGTGGGALGFQRARARVGILEADMQCVGGVDVDPLALRCFQRLVPGAPATQMDLFSHAQYVAHHGRQPAPGWREQTPQTFRAAFSARPHIMFMSTPCKGYSGLLSPAKAGTVKYQALNELALRCVWLTLEAWADHPEGPPDLILFENVPRIAQRGRHLLDQIKQLLGQFGYASVETVHDCGELAEHPLAQTRKRFLLVARRVATVPAHLYEPQKRTLRAIGEVIGTLPLPDDPRAGPMHLLPNLQWTTWVRLALIPAGQDWRALQSIDHEALAIEPIAAPRYSSLGVQEWEAPAGTVCGRSMPHNGAFAIADPRIQLGDYQAYGVRHWSDTCGVVGAKAAAGGGAFSVADPRRDAGQRFNNVYRVIAWDKPAGTVTTGGTPSAGGLAIADPRVAGKGSDFQSCGNFGVQPWDASSLAVTGHAKPDNGRFSIADPRVGWSENAHRNKLAVVPWEDRAGTVTSSHQVASGAISVADPRLSGWREGQTYSNKFQVQTWGAAAGCVTGTPDVQSGAPSVADPRLPAAARSPVIISTDGTWHRPLTTLELAALQSFPVEDGALWLTAETTAHSKARELIGNAVPPASAEAIASVFADVLLRAKAGESFCLSATPVWVRPLAIALSVDLPIFGGAA